MSVSFGFFISQIFWSALLCSPRGVLQYPCFLAVVLRLAFFGGLYHIGPFGAFHLMGFCLISAMSHVNWRTCWWYPAAVFHPLAVLELFITWLFLESFSVRPCNSPSSLLKALQHLSFLELSTSQLFGALQHVALSECYTPIFYCCTLWRFLWCCFPCATFHIFSYGPSR